LKTIVGGFNPKIFQRTVITLIAHWKRILFTSK